MMNRKSLFLLSIALMCFVHLASAQTFNVIHDGLPIIPGDTLEVTASGGSGYYSTTIPLNFQNTGNSPLDLAFMMDDSGVLPPAQLFMGCFAGGCFPPGQNAGVLGVVLTPGQVALLVSPVFECYDPSCWGTHMATITFSDVAGVAVPLQFHIRITIPTGVGIAENNSGDLSLHPNPANDFVQLRSMQEVKILVLSDLMGRVVYTTYPASGLNEKLDVSGFDNGVYFVTLYTDDASITGKLLVQH